MATSNLSSNRPHVLYTHFEIIEGISDQMSLTLDVAQELEPRQVQKLLFASFVSEYVLTRYAIIVSFGQMKP